MHLPQLSSALLRHRTYHAARKEHEFIPSRKWYTTLRIKTILALSVTLAALLTLCYLPLRHLYLESFLALEQRSAQTDIDRVRYALSSRLEQLDKATLAWSTWDDTYTFLKQPSQAYIDTNTGASWFTTYSINLMLFFDSSGKLVFGKAVDLTSGNSNPVPQALLDRLAKDPPPRGHSLNQGLTGIVPLPEGLLLVAARPILPSSGKGPSNGMLILGRYLDSAEFAQLAKMTQITFTLHAVDDPQLPADVVGARVQLFEQAADMVQVPNEQTLVGYGLVRDVYGNPTLITRVQLARDIYAQGRSSIGYFSFALMVVGLLFGGVMLLLVERVVLARVIRLSATVRGIGSSGDPSARVTVTGRDELYELGTSVNHMLDALQKATIERQQAEAARLTALEQINAQQQELVAQLQMNLMEREKVERLKNEFISVVSHELRTPLTSIRGSLGLVIGGVAGTIPPAAKSMLEIANNNGERLVRLINDILDVEKIESGRLQLDIQPINVPELLARVLEENCGYGVASGVTFVLDSPIDDLQIIGDQDRLRQIMANLLSNAAKYSHAGGSVHVQAVRHGHDLRIRVIDTGSGIPHAFRERIFQKFAQADSSDTRQKGGTGLGLNICKMLIEQMGGRIGFSSTPGVGTTFFIDLRIYNQEP